MNLKYFSLAIILSIASLAPTFSQNTSQPSRKNPRVVFYRNTGALKSAAICKIYLGEQLLCKIGNQSGWTSTFSSGEYSFRTVLSLDSKTGKPTNLILEAGKLYLIEIKIGRDGHQQAIPSAGYYFVLNPVEEKRLRGQLKNKFVQEVIRKALFEEMLREYGLE